ncbi:hypothetical protein GCM10009718_18910 [Isoptericola halotolerans]|uniref:DUF2076 domain-containing protein n=1 Tax=Isoptericola halotolerans TaxID=300560 RepID=A0ABX2A949_9MICO|nr:hypothetical protein [Isoptericola halotolerans]NOV98525.1 hypothetical protein [Isoptericola halotolerans]
MGFLDRLLGRSRDERSDIPGMTGGAAPRGYQSPTQDYARSAYQQPTTTHTVPSTPAAGQAPGRHPDDVALDRYRYLLRTAPPDAVEQAHAEAFAQLSPEQRRRVLTEVGASLPASERATSDDPQALARMATRAEMRSPGTLERSFAGSGAGRAGAPGFGSMVGSSMLGTVAGVVIGSAVANALFGPMFGDPSTPVAEDAAAGGEEAMDDGGDVGGDIGDGGVAEAGMADAGGAEAAGDEGLFGGFFGGDGGGGLFGGDGGGFDGGFDF